MAWPLSRLQSAILALIIVDAIIVGWRSDFVRFMPQTASFYAAIGMPVNITSSVAAPYSNPIAPVLIAAAA